MYVYQINIVPKWSLNFTDDYFFSSENKLINKRTGKELKKTVKVYTIGYNIKGKFYSLNKLRKCLKKVEKESLPF
jgi:hypothetical protein